MNRTIFEILDGIPLATLIKFKLPARFHAKQFYDLLQEHYPNEYQEMRNRYAHKPEREIDGLIDSQISKYLLNRSKELNIRKIENEYYEYTTKENNISKVSCWSRL